MRSLTPAILALALACQCALAGPPQPTGARPQPAGVRPQPARVRLWTRADLQSLTRTLDDTGAPYAQLIKGNTHGALLLHRAVSGDPELHAKLNDFFVVLGGEGEIRVGGQVTGEKTVAPDEKRGQKLTGGALYRVRRGDVLFVPANHWLQVLVADGRVLQALIIKTQ